ncbi:metalloendopeptidase [Desmophyllum pertusum]|uniref:Metalloendopeptidase n=1 Tax=Desmophyllum pertusum TaxID=174260 RepID=A0A9W9ZC61_9CNID|nr:metalloendopeptidase [Desmophyllum pertusum]
MVGAIGGEQILNMGSGCQYVGLVLHEFGHAIGYFHEHNRPDRDDVVDIKWDNVQYGFKDAFYKYTFDEADVQGFKYDLTSIMHYENSAFTNGYCRPTMLVKNDPSYEVTPVYLREFSPQDIQKINKLYSCQTTQLPPTECVCKDKYPKCPEWKTWGECHQNMMWMTTNCPKSCRTCGEPPSDCQDVYPVACEKWGKDGECDNNPMWMIEHCKRTCKECTGPTQLPGTCQDKYDKCPAMKTSGECHKNMMWMNTNCPKSCRICGEPPSDCQDLYPVACEKWGKDSECAKNPIWMNENCKRTCKQCTGPTQPPLTGATQPPIPPLPGTTQPPLPGTTQAPIPSLPGTTQPPQPPQPTTQPSGDCKDVYPDQCPTWKTYKWCEKDQVDYMAKVCKKTCGFCGGSGNCKDVYPQYCPGYKQNGMCTDPNYLDYCKDVCKYTCGYCS